MKKAGIIGGLSTLSTELFYREINKLAQSIEPVEYPALMINSVALKDFLPHLNDQQKLIDMINLEIAKVHDHVDVVAITCNTVHYTIDEIRKFSKSPVLAIQEEVRKKVEQSGIKKIGLLGTKTTMDQHLYQKELDKIGVDYVTLEESEQERLNQLIFQEIIYGKGQEKMAPLSKKYVQYFEEMGCDGILLACTELSLFFSQEETKLQMLSTLKILSDSVFEYIKAESN